MQVDKMQVEELSNKYKVCRLDSNNVNAIFELCSKNSIYYEFCPPFVTMEGIMNDMQGLPPGKTKSDKYYLGYFENNILIAVMDLISGYPDLSTAYIGFFMMDIKVQGKGIGTEIIEELCQYLTKSEFERVELAWVKGNPQAERFWIKNNFDPIGERSSNSAKLVIAAERKLELMDESAKEQHVCKTR